MMRPRATRPSVRSVVAPVVVFGMVAVACSSDDGGDDAVSSDASGATADSTADAGADDVSGQSNVDDAAVVDPTTLDWKLCDDLGVDGGPPLECSTLQVPLDHAAPDAEQIDIAVARVNTASAADQIGHLVFNPGGPGGSGLEFLVQATFTIPVEVQDRFDLVAFDPRGVGRSTALACAIEIDDQAVLLQAGDDDGWQGLVDEAMAATDDCTADTLALAPFVGTNNVARDLDLLRDALGDDGLSYVGYSYGTRLGATYAELFPQNVRALVLDAGVKPVAELSELELGQALGFDRALANFAAACDGDGDCVLQEIGSTLDVIDGLRSELDEIGDFPAGDDRVLTRAEFDLGIVAALYSKDAWPFLAQALYLAETEQDGELLQVLADGLQGRRPDGTYDNSRVANVFINCADDPTRPTADEVRAGVEEAAERSEFFSDALRASTGCLGLDAATDPLRIGPAAGAPPILVIGTTGDPATPFEWSVELADSLESGTLFSVEAEGHIAYGSIECVSEPVSTYLIELTVPADLECSDNESADFFVPAGEGEIDVIVRLFDCLRENGADIPEINAADVLADPTGEVIGEFLDPTDPAFAQAILGCGEVLAALEATL